VWFGVGADVVEPFVVIVDCFLPGFGGGIDHCDFAGMECGESVVEKGGLEEMVLDVHS